MSVTRTGGFRRSHDHFEPETDSDPHTHRRMRGLLEQIDYTAYAANKELVGQALGQGDIRKFQRMAIACAQARAVWVAQALAASASGGKLSSADLAQLTHLRTTFEELTEAYEAMRRMVERGYLTMPAAPAG